MSDIDLILDSAVRVTGTVEIEIDPETGDTGRYVLQRVGKGFGNIPQPLKHDMQLRRHVVPHDPRTPSQLAGRARIAAATAAWHELSETERQTFRDRAHRLHMTGFNLHIREFCRSSPLADWYPPPEPTLVVLRPSSDYTVGGWSPEPLFARINSELPDDGTYIQSNSGAVSSSCEILLDGPNESPGESIPGTLRYRISKSANGGELVIAYARLRSPSGIYSSLQHYDIDTGFVTFEQTFSVPANTNLSELRVELMKIGEGIGGAGRWRDVIASWVEVELLVP